MPLDCPRFISRSNKDDPYCVRLFGGENRVVWSRAYSAGSQRVFALYRLLNVVRVSKPVGVLRLEIQQADIASLFSKEEGRRVCIINPNGDIIASSVTGLAGRGITDTAYAQAFSAAPYHAIGQCSVDGISYDVIRESIGVINSAGWSLLFMAPASDMAASVNRVVRSSAIVSAVIFIITISMVLIISKEQLLQMDSLVKQREAELKALQWQINPHFLFNTLDSIRTHVMLEEKEKAGLLLASLVKLFRYIVGRKGDSATLAQEVEHIQNYLEIYKIRYGDTMDYSINIPTDLSECTLPRLTLQPIVENALVHGLKHKRGGLFVEIGAAETDGGRVCVTVRDNGSGLSPEETARFNDAIISGQTVGGLGLRNLYDRLKLSFGTDASLRVDSAFGQWFMVSVIIPKGGAAR